MVETIHPVVHGGRNRSYVTAVAIHALAAATSSALLGGLLGGIGAAAGAPWGSVGPGGLAFAALLYLLREAVGLPVPLLDRRRQVPEWWRTFYSAPTSALLYGLGLGAGYFTYLSHGTFVVVSAAALVSGNPWVGALLAAPFGLARGLSVAVGCATDTEAAVYRLEEIAQGSAVRVANAVAVALLGIAAAVASVSS